MKKKIFIITIILLFFVGSGMTYAKEENSTNQNKENRNSVEKNRRLAASKDSSPSAKNRREKEQEPKELREEHRASASALREQFKLKLEAVKDERKKLILEKLADKMNRINARRVEHWKKILARLTDILNRIKTTGKHNGELDAAVALADNKLASAFAAVDAQASKEYTISLASESALKLNAGAAISSEQKDLQSVLKLVIEAKQAVHKSLMILKKSFGGPLPKFATSSGTPATDSGEQATESATP